MSVISILRPKRKINIWQTIFFIALIFLAGFFLLQSSIFDIKTITVENNNKLTDAEIINVSGLTEGSNIFKANLIIAEEKIKVLAQIETVKIKRKLPAFIEITVTERKSVLTVVNNNEFNEIDSNGILLKKNTSLGDTGTLILTGITLNKDTLVGQAYDSKQLMDVLEVVNQMPEQLADSLSEINYKDSQITIYTNTGLPIKFGILENIPEKIDLIQNILVDVNNNKKVDYIDISYYNSPVIKYK